MSRSYKLYTMQNSPYSDKIRAFLAYKKLDVTEFLENAETRFTVLQARTGKTMVPVVITPDDEAMNDSTAIAAHIENAHPEPPTRWKDPETDAIAMLLEDYADEWLVRIMLSSRWYHAADSAQNAAIIACTSWVLPVATMSRPGVSLSACTSSGVSPMWGSVISPSSTFTLRR